MEQHLKTYFANRNEIAAVYLFGSYAKDKPKRFSDIDIAVLFGISDRDTIDQMMEKYQIELSRLMRKDIHLVSLNLAGEVLLSQIFQTGKCILINDRKKLADFRIIAYSRVFDFNYHLQKMRNGLIRKVLHG